MSYQLTDRPSKSSYSKNVIRYLFHISNPDTPGSAMEIELYTVAINEPVPTNGIGTLISSQTLYPDKNGTVEFYCEDLLDAYLEWQQPALASNDIIPVTRQIRKYYIRYRQVTSFNDSPAWATDQQSVRIVLKGGVAKEKFERNNFFVSYMPANKPFLTWSPANHFLGTEERRYLTYFHNAEDLTLQLKLKANVIYTDGTIAAVYKDFPSLATTRLFHLPAGLEQLGLLNIHPDKQIWSFDLSVEDSGGIVWAAPYRLYADYRQFYNIVSFVYHNSLGGIDTVRIRGEIDTELNRIYTETQSVLSYSTGEMLPSENSASNISMYDSFKGDVGFLNTVQAQDALKDLMQSETVYQVIGGKWLQVVITIKNQKVRSSDDTKWSFELQWRYTFDNTQYTPFNKMLGAGSEDEQPGAVYGVCTAPTGLTVELVEYVTGGVKYRFKWNATDTSIGYELFIALDNSDYPATGTLVNATTKDVVLTAYGDYKWKVRSQCSESDYSGFSSGAGFAAIENVPLCQVPASLSIMLISSDSTTSYIKFVWAAISGVVGYVVEWRAVGSSTWNSQSVNTNSYTIGLSKNTQYEWRVKTNCSAGNYSIYTYGDPFLPGNLMGTCAIPTNLTVTKKAQTFNTFYAVLSWDNANGAQDYQLEYRRPGMSTEWIVVGNTQPGYIIQHSNAYGNLQYEWRVRSNCVGTGVTTYANGNNFTV